VIDKMSERTWVYSVDGLSIDEPPRRVDRVVGGLAVEFGLDPYLVGLAIDSDHIDAKICLSDELIEIHTEYQKIKSTGGQVNLAGLLPDAAIDRLVYGMIAQCSEGVAVPNILLRLLSMRLGVSPRTLKGVRNMEAYRKLLQICADNPEFGKKKAGELAGISPNTAMRYMNRPEFKASVAALRIYKIKLVT
jgi:hypothetical protein